MKDKPAGIYVHIPFCLQRCFYCDFYSTTDSDLQDAYLDALLKEIMLTRKTSLCFDTLYIGGGTPSVLDPAAIGRIVDAAGQAYALSAQAEITLEANPGTMDAQRLQGFRAAGVNRLNLGVQSFQEDLLRFLGRIHSAVDAVRTMEWARGAGFDNIGLDLIYGLPGQTETTWIDDLKQALELEPEHLSCYMLTYEPGTPLDQDRRKGRFRPLDEGLAGDLFEITMAYLKYHGYEHYEISNFARITTPDRAARRSRHNCKYWSFAPYIGLGAAAHSFFEPQRSWNHRSIERYMGDLKAGLRPVAGKESLSPEQFLIEAVYLGLRTTRGIDLAAVDKKLGINFCSRFADLINDLKQRDLIDTRPGRLALTPRGMRFLDSIAAMFVTHDHF
jgi:oxygen-independent coproporphyrinogen-3 oxidase